MQCFAGLTVPQAIYCVLEGRRDRLQYAVDNWKKPGIFSNFFWLFGAPFPYEKSYFEDQLNATKAIIEGLNNRAITCKDQSVVFLIRDEMSHLEMAKPKAEEEREAVFHPRFKGIGCHIRPLIEWIEKDGTLEIRI